jgi:hypothetical protein
MLYFNRRLEMASQMLQFLDAIFGRDRRFSTPLSQLPLAGRRWL